MSRQLIIVSSLIFFAIYLQFCNDATSTPTIEPAIRFPIKNIIFSFQEELMMEIWQDGHLLKDNIPISFDQHIPVGVYRTTSFLQTGFITFTYPNSYYRSKAVKNPTSFQTFSLDSIEVNIQITEVHSLNLDSSSVNNDWQIVILPNDSRSGKSLTPSMHTPHWMAEQYSFLELLLKQYPKDSINTLVQ